jgi:hypothetical protein
LPRLSLLAPALSVLRLRVVLLRVGVLIFLDDRRGLVVWHDDRASPQLCRALETHSEEVADLLLHPGWFDCHCERCIQIEGVH